MASNYPASLDSFDTIASDKKTSDTVGGRTHRDMHNDLGDAIEAVQGELGTDPAGAYATVKARLDAIETLPAIDAKGDILVGSADNAYDNLAVGHNGYGLVADSTQTLGVRWAPVGNLLHPNAANGTEDGTTTGVAAYNSTGFASSTDQAFRGSRSIKCPVTNAASGFTTGGTASTGTIPVVGLTNYTATVQAYANGTITGVLMRVYWWTTAGNVAASTASTTVTVPIGTGAWQQVTASFDAPSNAAYASIYIAHSGGTTSSDTIYFDQPGFWAGFGGQWTPVGQPVVGTYGPSSRKSNTASSYSLVASDAFVTLECNRGTAQTVTVPLNSSVAFPIGTRIELLQVGAGAVSVSATGGVTVNANPGLSLAGQWAAATLLKRGTDTWVLLGNLA